MSEETTTFYKQIDGKKYSKRLIDLADSLVSGQGDGRLSIADANKIYESLENDGKYTDLEKETISYLRHAKNEAGGFKYSWTDAADTNLRRLVSVWAGIRGANK